MISIGILFIGMIPALVHAVIRLAAVPADIPFEALSHTLNITVQAAGLYTTDLTGRPYPVFPPGTPLREATADGKSTYTFYRYSSLAGSFIGRNYGPIYMAYNDDDSVALAQNSSGFSISLRFRINAPNVTNGLGRGDYALLRAKNAETDDPFLSLLFDTDDSSLRAEIMGTDISTNGSDIFIGDMFYILRNDSADPRLRLAFNEWYSVAISYKLRFFGIFEPTFSGTIIGPDGALIKFGKNMPYIEPPKVSHVFIGCYNDRIFTGLYSSNDTKIDISAAFLAPFPISVQGGGTGTTGTFDILGLTADYRADVQPIHVDATPSTRSRDRPVTIIIPVVGGGTALCFALIALALWLRRRRRLSEYSGLLAPSHPSAAAFRKSSAAAPSAHPLLPRPAGQGAYLVALDSIPGVDTLRPEQSVARGYSACVYVVRDAAGTRRALKVFDLAATAPHAKLDFSSYAKEIELLARLTHENIIGFLGHAMARDGSRCYILMELAESLSLDTWVVPEAEIVLPSDRSSAIHAAEYVASIFALRAAVLARANAELHFDRFSAVRVYTTPYPAHSVEGGRVLQAVARGSRLACANDADAVLPTPPPPPTKPLLVLSVGPHVVSYAMEIDTLRDADRTYAFFCEKVRLLPALSFQDRLRIMIETWRGVRYLHTYDDQGAANGAAGAGKKAIVHADLKPANILLTSDLRARLADVGLSTVVQVASHVSYVNQQPNYGVTGGTKGYKDPATEELVPKYGTRNDVYSAGATMFDVLPAALTDCAETARALADLMRSCVKPWAERPSSEALLVRLEGIYAQYVDRQRTRALQLQGGPECSAAEAQAYRVQVLPPLHRGGSGALGGTSALSSGHGSGGSGDRGTGIHSGTTVSTAAPSSVTVDVAD